MLNPMAQRARGKDSKLARSVVDAGQPYEKFARAYEQYIATKSGDAKLLGQLADQRAEIIVGPLKYWSGENFAPIVQAFDEHFSAQGWK